MPPWRELLGARELMLGAAAIGLVIGISWADEQWVCAHIDEHEHEVALLRESLDGFVEERCAALGCEELELVSQRGCLAKIRTRAVRVDKYGDEIGTFVSVEGLRYSPMLGRWRVDELLDDKQVLGLPVR
jgi:hypothetical protein